MKHLKIYEEFYTQEDLQGLIDDLSGVGLADKFRVECNCFIMVPKKKVPSREWPEWAIRNIEVEVSCQEDKNIIYEKAFEKVLRGEFTQESNVYLDKMFESVPELVSVLGKEHTIELAKKAEKMSPQHISGRLFTLQAKLLIPEIESLMHARAIKDKDYKLSDLHYLSYHIRYSIRYTKV